MKRLSLRELWPLLAPLAIIGGAVVLVEMAAPAKIRQAWAIHGPFGLTQPVVTECTLRPAAPLELARGAEVGLTLRALTPLHQTAMLQCHLADNGSGVRQVASSSRTDSYRRYVETTQCCSYRWPSGKRPISLQADVELWAMTGSTGADQLQCHYPLSLAGIPAPDLKAAQRTNFQIGKAVLQLPPAVPRAPLIELEVQDVVPQTPGSVILPPTAWRWHDSRGKPIGVTVETYSNAVDDLRSVTLQFDSTKSRRPTPGSSIGGLLSLGGGWPQSVTLEWPQKLSVGDDRTEMKVTAKLAPWPLP